MKIAIFRKVMGPNWNMDLTIQEKDFTPGCIFEREYTQLTDWVDVEFVFRSDESVVSGQLKQLDIAEQELRTQFATKLAEVAEARAKLLSLAHQTETV